MVRCRSLLLSLEKVAAEDSRPRFPAAQAGGCAGCCEMVDVTSTAQPSDTPGPPKVVVPAQAVSGVLRDKSTLLQGAGLGPWRGVGGGRSWCGLLPARGGPSSGCSGGPGVVISKHRSTLPTVSGTEVDNLSLAPFPVSYAPLGLSAAPSDAASPKA